LMTRDKMSSEMMAMCFLLSGLCAYWCFNLLVFKWAVVVHSVRTGSTILGHLKKYMMGLNVLQAVSLITIWTLVLTLDEHRKTLVIVGQMMLAIPTLGLAIAVIAYGIRLVNKIKESSKRMSGIVKKDDAKQAAALKTLLMAMGFGILFLIKAAVIVAVAFGPTATTQSGVLSGWMLVMESLNSFVTVLAYGIVLFVFGDKLHWGHVASEKTGSFITRMGSFVRSRSISQDSRPKSKWPSAKQVMKNSSASAEQNRSGTDPTKARQSAIC